MIGSRKEKDTGKQIKKGKQRERDRQTDRVVVDANEWTDGWTDGRDDDGLHV